MPDPRPGRRAPWRRALAPMALLAAIATFALLAPGLALGRASADLSAPDIHEAAVPEGERCTEGSPNPDVGLKVCEKPLLSAENLLPIFGGAVGAGVLALVVAFVVLRRRASVPLEAIDSDEWWACPKCGSTNVVGSARCYSCGTWQR